MRSRRYRSGSRWSLWRWTEVVIGGELYLRRLHLLQTPWFSVMLHWIPRPDPQPDMHDHPVDFLSITLRGGYVELRPWRCGIDFSRVRLRRSTDRHRIVATFDDTLTLVLAGPVKRQWGFWTPLGWVPWREYEATRGGPGG